VRLFFRRPTDCELVFHRRGRRQHLHFAWVKVRKTWLSHGIPTVIARRLEASLDSGGWE
jgi:E3 ubiquitin-protein ligase UBR1